MNMLLLSSHLDSNWYFQRQHTGMGNRTPCYLQFSFVWKRRAQAFPCVLFSHQIQGIPSWSRRQRMLLLFLFHVWFLFPLKNTFNQHAAIQYPDRRNGRKEDLLPMRVSCMWHSPITDLLRNWHDLPVDIRQLWSFPILFSSKCVKLSPQLQLPMALIHGAKFTYASCSHLRQRDFND